MLYTQAGPYAAVATESVQRQSGGSVYLRLSTRVIEQPARQMDDALAKAVIDGGYWLVPPQSGARVAVAYAGAVAPEAIAAHRAIDSQNPGAGLLAVTSLERLHADWLENGDTSTVATLLGALDPAAGLVSVLDGHPASLSWLGAVRGHRIRPLGVSHFGQSADIPDLYAAHHIDAAAISAAARSLSKS